MATLDITNLINQLLGTVQNLMGQLGNLLAQAASSAAVMFGWGFFIVMISYFILAESKGAPEYLTNIHLPGYTDDLQKLEEQLNKIWNAFLRGQTLVTGLNIIIYTIVLGGLGVQYFYVLAVAAGIARIIPYLGAWVSWVTFGLIAFFQGYTLFGLNSFQYSLMVVIVAIISDTIMDNFVTPRVMSNSLKVHPAAVMVAAIIGISWLGIVGVILAAPVLATLKLFGTYALMKLFDRNPWQEMQVMTPRSPGITRIYLKRAWTQTIFFFRQLFKSKAN
jgi:predicted PurR-regulated permease PerM